LIRGKKIMGFEERFELGWNFKEILDFEFWVLISES
jgi:hypothetical protein